MSPNVYLDIVSSIRIAYCFVRIAIRIVSVFIRIDPALVRTFYVPSTATAITRTVVTGAYSISQQNEQTISTFEEKKEI